MRTRGGAFALSMTKMAWVVIVCLVGFQIGCDSGGDGTERFQLSGKVTFDGKPVPAGRIVFGPDGVAGNSGPQGFATIENGTFDTASGKGTVGGPHLVRITGLSAAALESAAEGSETASEGGASAALFPDYEEKLDLPKEQSTHDFDVPASAASAAPAGGF